MQNDERGGFITLCSSPENVEILDSVCAVRSNVIFIYNRMYRYLRYVWEDRDGLKKYRDLMSNFIFRAGCFLVLLF